MKPKRIEGATYLGELPPGDWTYAQMSNGETVAACPQHPPHIIKKDGVYRLEFGPGGKMREIAVER